MILHCKNTENGNMLPFLHFYSARSYIFLSFFNMAVFYIGGNKKSKKYFFFKMQKLGSEDP